MRLRHIEVFHAVYSSGSVTRAARLLNVSQPSVSKVLAHAEQQLGYPLFDRVKGKLVPTPEADLLFDHVGKVNEQLERLRSLAENLGESEKGMLRIAATPAFGVEVLPKAIASWQLDYPKCFFTVETLHYGEICRALLDGRVDMGLVFDHEPLPLLSEDVLANGKFVPIAPAEMGFMAHGPVSIKDIAEYPFIELDARGPLGRQLEEHITQSGVQLNVVARAETYQTAKGLVAHGAGVSIIDEITARSSGFEHIHIGQMKPELTFRISALHWNSIPLSNLGRRFLRHLEQEIRLFIA